MVLYKIVENKMDRQNLKWRGTKTNKGRYIVYTKVFKNRKWLLQVMFWEDKVVKMHFRY